MNTDEMLGELVVERHADYGPKDVTVKKREGSYTVLVAGKRLHADCLNMAGAASGLSDGANLHLGGDRDKRVTITENAGDRYAYVETGER
jgi:hypothetical protein